MTTPATVCPLRDRALRSLSTLPPFSPILHCLISSLARENVAFSRVADLIEQDTVLAGNILALVNSPLYRRSATIGSVRHAVALLGVDKLRNAALGMSVTQFWEQVRMPRGWSIKTFNLHSFGAATLADVLSQVGPVEYAEGAFAAGLFHDLGRLLIAIALPFEHDQVARLMTTGNLSRCECEREILGFTHAELSADALAKWNLPAQIQTAVQYHHAPDSAPPSKGLISLGRVVGVANDCLNALGYAVDESQTTIEEAVSSFDALGLNQSLAPLLTKFATDFESTRAMI